jgi:hypothetical protein
VPSSEGTGSASKRVEAAGLVLGLTAAALAPWILYLAVSLPQSHTVQHWRIVWTGFDVALATSLVATALAALGHRWWLSDVAAATATLLLVDVWFDILTAANVREVVAAALEASLAELPVATLCVWLALDARRLLRPVATSRAAPRRREADRVRPRSVGHAA